MDEEAKEPSVKESAEFLDKISEKASSASKRQKQDQSSIQESKSKPITPNKVDKAQTPKQETPVKEVKVDPKPEIKQEFSLESKEPSLKSSHKGDITPQNASFQKDPKVNESKGSIKIADLKQNNSLEVVENAHLDKSVESVQKSILKDKELVESDYEDFNDSKQNVEIPPKETSTEVKNENPAKKIESKEIENKFSFVSEESPPIEEQKHEQQDIAQPTKKEDHIEEEYNQDEFDFE